MTKDDLIRLNLEKAANYGKNIQGQTFRVADNYPDTELGNILKQTDKNSLARAILFEMYWRKFMFFMKDCHDTLTPKEEDEAIEQLNFIIKIYESTNDTWLLFWEGKQPIDPRKMPLIGVGKEQVQFIDLNDVSEINIPYMGIK